MTPEHFKGMLVASSNRWQGALDSDPSSDPFDPRSLWRLWDSFGIDSAVMHGWWLDRERGNGTVPVTASDPRVKVTSYVKKGEATLLAVASFATTSLNVTLAIDWTALGLAPKSALTAPKLAPFQGAASFSSTGEIPVAAGQGWMFLIGSGAETQRAA